MTRLNEEDWNEYCRKAEALRERGVQVGDVLCCDDGATPTLHPATNKPHVRISEYSIIDGTGPRFFVHGFAKGLVAYVPDGKIPAGAKLRVVDRFEKSAVLKLVEDTRDPTLDAKLFEIELDLGDLEEELRETHPEIADKLFPIIEKVQDLQEEAQ